MLGRGRGVEQRGVVRRVDHRHGPDLPGIGLDGIEDLFLDRLDQLEALFHQRALLSEEALLELLGLLLLVEDRLLAHLTRRGRERCLLVHVVVVEGLDLLEAVVHLLLVLLGKVVQVTDGLVVGVDGLEDLFAVHDDAVLGCEGPGCQQGRREQNQSFHGLSRFGSLGRRQRPLPYVNITLFFQFYCQPRIRTAVRARSGTGCRSSTWSWPGRRIRSPSRCRACRRRAGRAARRSRPNA